MNKKQIEKKQKKRKEIARKRVLSRRKQIRDERKREESLRRQFEAEFELKNGKTKPFIKDQEAIKKRDEIILSKIKKNYELLENLEKERLANQISDEQSMEKYKNMEIKERAKVLSDEGREFIAFPGEKIKSSDFWFVLKKIFVILFKVLVKITRRKLWRPTKR